MTYNTPSYMFFVSFLIAEFLLIGICSCDPIFDVKVHKALNTNTSSTNMEVSSSCNCRGECITSDGCIAYWTYPKSYRWKCYLFLYGATHYLINATKVGGICAVRIYPGSKWETDGMYYFIPTKASLDFTSAREDCKVALGYRLALIKTPHSYKAALAKYQLGYPYAVVDLQLNMNEKNATFGDGTPFQDSQVAKAGVQLRYNVGIVALKRAFVLFDGFYGEDAEGPHSALCQGDPLGITL